MGLAVPVGVGGCPEGCVQEAESVGVQDLETGVLQGGADALQLFEADGVELVRLAEEGTLWRRKRRGYEAEGEKRARDD